MTKKGWYLKEKFSLPTWLGYTQGSICQTNECQIIEPWEEDWQAGEWEEDKESLKWLRSRPDPIKKLLLMFPPSCLVKANRPLRCPAPGKVGIVTSLLEPDEEHPLGWVTVRPSPTADTKFHCRIEWLEVIGYYKGLTPERVKELLGEKHGLENGTTKD